MTRNLKETTTSLDNLNLEIAERKKKEEALRISEKKYRKLFDNMLNGFAFHEIILNENNLPVDYTFIEVNHAFEEQTGLKRVEIVGKKVSEVLPGIENDPVGWIEIYGKVALTGNGIQFENYSEPLQKWYSINVYSTQKGYFATIFEDITKRKKAEETILNSEKRYKYLFEQSPISIWEEDFSELKKYLDSLKKKGIENFKDYFEKNPDEVDKCTRMVRILDINEMTVKLFNAKNKADLLTNLNNIYIEDSRTTFIEQFCLVANNQTNFSIETINKTIDGKTLDVLLNWAVVPGHEKNLSKVLITIIDITEKNKSEAEIRISSERLQMLNKIIRHDLSNDFIVINSAVKIFKRNSDVTLLYEIEKRVQKSLNAISGYREYESHLNSSTGLDELELSDVINNVAAENPKIKFKIEGAGRVFGDDALYSVLDNLVSNSIKHGKASQISIKISKDNDMCRLRFADNGTGIPEEIKEKVFEEGFHHGESGNTGIGLYIVKQTIERFGGTILVEDNEPNGTVFTMTLRKAL